MRPLGSYVSIQQSVTITSGVGILQEIPNRAAGITLTVSSTPVATNDATIGQLPTDSIISVDWDQGLIFTTPAYEGLSITANFIGMGAIFISSHRVFTQNSGNTITQTLDAVVSAASQFIFLNDYNNATSYKQYNIINYQSASFMYINTTSTSGHLPSDPIYWARISGNLFRGTYSTSTNYNSGDVITDSNNYKMYQSIISGNLNNPLTDATKWQLQIDVSGAVASANTATSNANAATTNATTATGLANTATSAANTATSSANTATSNANAATTNANNAATLANGLVTTFVSKGVYSAVTTYVPNNIVTSSGSSWRCLQNTTGNTPVEGVNWTLVADKGLDGTGAGTVTSISSGNGDLVITSPTTTPVITSTANQITVKSADATLTALERGIINVTTGATNRTITLPSAATSGIRYLIKKVDSSTGTITINTTSSQTIDGLLTRTLTTQYSYIQLVSDGSNWVITDISNPAPYDNSITITHNLNLYPDVLPIKTYSAYGNGGGFGSAPFGGGSLFKLINTVEYIDTYSLKVYLSDSFSGAPTVIQNSTNEFMVNFSTDQNSLTLLLK